MNMTKLAMLVSVAAMSFGGEITAANADEVPNFDISKSCKADVQAFQSNASGQASSTGCLTDERNARATLVSQWTQFAPDSRARCTRMVGDGAASQSYVELLTCLQMAKDVKGLPKD
jgi:hypothetical protein